MFRTKKDRRILGHYKKSNLEELVEKLLTKLGLLLDRLRVLILRDIKILGDSVTANVETLKHNIVARIEQRNELKQIEREAYNEEFGEVKVRRHDRAIELAKERGKQKAHGKKRKVKPRLTEEQLKAIETRRKQLGQIGRNLSSVIGNTSMQPRKKKTKEDLKAEIEKVKLEQELAELKKKPKAKGVHKGVQVGINPMMFGSGQSNALDNVLGFMGIQKKGKKNGR